MINWFVSRENWYFWIYMLWIIMSNKKIKTNASRSKHVTHFLTFSTFFKVSTIFRLFIKKRMFLDLNWETISIFVKRNIKYFCKRLLMNVRNCVKKNSISINDNFVFNFNNDLSFLVRELRKCWLKWNVRDCVKIKNRNDFQISLLNFYWNVK